MTGTEQNVICLWQATRQTPRVYHCNQVLFDRESDQNLQTTKQPLSPETCFCNNVQSIGLLKFINMLLLAVYS